MSAEEPLCCTRCGSWEDFCDCSGGPCFDSAREDARFCELCGQLLTEHAAEECAP